jgi:predicted alpha-1,6-mannanase (GH76 family)
MKTNLSFLFLCFILFQFVNTETILAQATGIESGSIYKLRSRANNKLLNVSNSSLGNSTNVDTWTDTDSDAERWIVNHLGNSIYTFQNVGTGKYLHIASTTLANSVNVDQYDNTNNNQVRWLIVNNGDGSYAVRATDNTGYSLDVNGGQTADGTNVQLWTNNTSGAQQWILEKVSSRVPAPTAAIADKVFEAWKTKYDIVNDKGFWGTAEMMEIVDDAYEVTGNAKYRDMFNQMYDKFIAREGADWMWNDFNDDIAWMVIACVRSSLLTGNATHLAKAKEQFDKMYARANTSSFGGGLVWKQGEGGKNSCINGPAMVACCYLAQATGDNSYYTKAINIYNWSKIYLFNENTGKVNDDVKMDQSGKIIIGNWSSTYNQGTYLGASVMLYNYTKDPSYLTIANRIAAYTKNDMYKSGVMNNEEGGNDLPGFKGIFMRYARRYVVDCNKADYIPWLQLNAKVAYNNRNSQNIITTQWATRTSETTTSSAFGASTAVSLMVNCPYSTNITRNAYTNIEAENFDYLKGVIVEPCPDGTSNLGGVQNGYYTGYNNVDFGTNGATAAEFRLSSTTGGTIEVRVGSPTGTLVGTAIVPTSEGWGVYKTITCSISGVSGLKNIYLVYKGDGYIANLNYFKFSNQNVRSGNQNTEVVTVYKDCNYANSSVGLPVGEYTLSQLNTKGILSNAISSLKVSEGYEVVAYQDSSFTGAFSVLSADDACLIDNELNDKINSLKIRAKSAARLGDAEIAAEAIQVWPNPATDNLFISSRELVGAKVTIFNAQGVELVKGKYDLSGLDVSQLKAGLYFIILEKDGKKINKRFVKN